MADPLSIASGVAGLLTLSISIADKLVVYVSSVRNAPKTMTAYVHEITALKNILSRLDELAQRSDKLKLFGAHGSALSEVNLEECRKELERIDAELQKRLRTSSKLEHLIWPFAESIVKRDVEMLQRYRATFQMALSADAVAISGKTLDEVQSLSFDIRQEAANDRDRAILNWLCPGGFEETHNAISARRQDYTGNWFLKKIEAWLTNPAALPIFWCRGIPGAGKTVLMSRVVDHSTSLRTHYGLDAVAYIYFNYKEQSNQTLDFIIGNILMQLYHQITDCKVQVGQLYEKSLNGTKRPNADTLINTLAELCQSSKVFLAFDALDEADPKTRQALVKYLAKPEIAHLPVFITSRPDIELKALAPRTWIEDTVAHDGDIEAYTRARFAESEDVQDILEDHAKAVIPHLVANVRQRAAGMFLLVVFQVEYICQQTSAKEMLEASRTMPSEANSIYAKTLEQINSQSKSQAELARKVLSWLVLAKSTLSLLELQDAIAIEPGTDSLDPLNRRTATTLVKVCRGLVVVDNDHFIRLAHLTVQEFLLVHLPEVHLMRLEIARSCLTYLSYSIFSTGPAKSAEQFGSRVHSYPFYRYACNHFPKHLQEAGEDRAITSGVVKFAKQPPMCYSYLQMFYSADGNPQYYDWFPSFTTSLHVAAMLGSAQATEAILAENETLVDEEDGDAFTSLYLAIQAGNAAVVRVLLDAGASKEGWAESALNCAARCRQDNIVRMILEQTITGDNQQATDQRNLFIAAITGDEESMALLLSQSVNADITDPDGGTALQWASWYGHTGIVEQLIASGVDIEAEDEKSRRAIHEACERGHTNVVKTLCEAGCDIEARDAFGFTPLCRAALSDNVELAEFLLIRGANMYVALNKRENLLHVALGACNVALVRLLLDRGLDPDGILMNQILWYQSPSWEQYLEMEKMVTRTGKATAIPFRHPS